MSTRLGVKRSGEVVSADERMGPDGRMYYDIQVCLTLPMRLPPWLFHTSQSFQVAMLADNLHSWHVGAVQVYFQDLFVSITNWHNHSSYSTLAGRGCVIQCRCA